MFVGHYGASLALKRVDKNASLGMLFLAVQFVDILFFPFVLLGIEHFNIVENYTASTHFELEFMPYTHSLFASFLWAAAVYIALRFYPLKKTENKNKIAIVMGVAVLSHWFLDLIVHTPDLPLLGDSSTKIGFGLWNNAVATYLLETILLLVGLGIYLKSTKGTTFVGKYGMIIFVVLMLIINANNIFGPPFGADVITMSVSALVMYFIFAGVAFWLDKKRS
ncbi:hypothetical protein LCGC14_1925920 [marine sediment metagenome]|uniref:Membrane-bound metal-dependent hydrolase n=1 Tax=marine sediment metagenome TaxID=412755 RepID=A0A0F9FQ19_9ZZZZ